VEMDEEMEGMLGMMELLFMLPADCRHAIELKPIVDMLK
jgi:hypothetical protein